jgi:hypothetical protein
LIESPNSVEEEISISFYDNLRKAKESDKGLGSVPMSRINSVSSLLLFNAKGSPYKSYAPIDNLAAVEKKKKAKIVESKIPPPPVTTAIHDIEATQEISTYVPVAEAVTLNLPLRLDLPNVAELEFPGNSTVVSVGSLSRVASSRYVSFSIGHCNAFRNCRICKIKRNSCS